MKWKEFKKYRTKIKSPLTIHAEKLCIDDLKKIINDGFKQDDIINKTIMSGKWKSFYPVKNKKTVSEGRVQPKEFKLEIPDDIMSTDELKANVLRLRKNTKRIGS